MIVAPMRCYSLFNFLGSRGKFPALCDYESQLASGLYQPGILPPLDTDTHTATTTGCVIYLGDAVCVGHILPQKLKFNENSNKAVFIGQSIRVTNL